MTRKYIRRQPQAGAAEQDFQGESLVEHSESQHPFSGLTPPESSPDYEGGAFDAYAASYYGDDAEKAAQALTPKLEMRQRGKLEKNTPPSRPGFIQCWKSVAARSGDILDGKWNAARNEGWSPRNPSTVPPGFFISRKAFGGYPGGVIYLDGMVLCEIPKAYIEKKREISKQQRALERGSLEDDLKEAGQRAGLAVESTHQRKVIAGGRASFAP